MDRGRRFGQHHVARLFFSSNCGEQGHHGMLHSRTWPELFGPGLIGHCILPKHQLTAPEPCSIGHEAQGPRQPRRSRLCDACGAVQRPAVVRSGIARKKATSAWAADGCRCGRNESSSGAWSRAALELVPATQVFVNISEKGKCLSCHLPGSHASALNLQAWGWHEIFVAADGINQGRALHRNGC